MEFGRLIIHLLYSERYLPYQQWVISQLSTTPDVLAHFTSNEEFILRLLVYTQPLLAKGQELQEEVWKVWNIILLSKKSFLKDFLTRIPIDKDDSRKVMFQPQALLDVKKIEEKEKQIVREWTVDRLTSIDKKIQASNKIKDKLRQTNRAITNIIISHQQQLMKNTMEHLQQVMEQDKALRRQWKMLLKKVTHERAIWASQHKTHWRLDPTEGAQRTRLRLKRAVHYPPFLTPYNITDDLSEDPPDQLIPPEVLSQRLMSEARDGSMEFEVLRNPTFLKPEERILSYFRCARINPFNKRDGELLIGETYIYFVDEGKKPEKRKIYSNSPKNLMWACEDIMQVHKRRYLLKNNAMEIFLTNGKTYLLAFEHLEDRDTVYEQIMSLNLPNRVDYESEVSGGMLKMSITKKWKKGLISNFEYLMHLNTLAGRSFNDLTQYPIFPLLVADNQSQKLDLRNPSTFRDLSKPMGAQDPERLAKFEERYNQLVEMDEQPFHYGSHYSNVGSVLHFLVRLEPFTRYFIDFQGGRFDVPDRAFHSIQQTWLLSSSLSSSDVKEIIPEFFYLPEFLMNLNRFDMGVKQDGQRVDDVVIPPWANGARSFIKKHREALECKHVSENLHHWIDLLFGYKQQGDEALLAKNVFHPLTYEGAVDIDAIEDVVTKEATIAQISSYGQTPKQLFKRPHPERDVGAQMLLLFDTVFSHPQHLTPFPMYSTSNPIGSLFLINDTPTALTPNKTLIYPRADQVISWGHWDQSLRICALETGKVLSVIETFGAHSTLCGEMPRKGGVLVTAGDSSVVRVWKMSRNPKTKMEQIKLHSQLFGHSDSVLSICVSQV